MKEDSGEAEESTDRVLRLEQSQFKQPRYSRRVQSKSEPSHAQDDSQPEANPAIVIVGREESVEVMSP